MAPEEGKTQVPHNVEAVEVVKLAGPLGVYRFACSCGREGQGWHSTPESAIRAGHDHVRF